MTTDLTQFPAPGGPGSVSAAPNLSAGFTETFSSRSVDTGGLRQHAVIGGEGPPLLLVHGWPQNWYAWRLVMPALAQHFTVIAVDQRGMGLTDKPETGYDSGMLAADLVAQAAAEGDMRADIDPATTAKLLFGLVNSLIEWYRPGRGATGAQLADAVCAMAFSGLRVRSYPPG